MTQKHFCLTLKLLPLPQLHSFLATWVTMVCLWDSVLPHPHHQCLYTSQFLVVSGWCISHSLVYLANSFSRARDHHICLVRYCVFRLNSLVLDCHCSVKLEWMTESDLGGRGGECSQSPSSILRLWLLKPPSVLAHSRWSINICWLTKWVWWRGIWAICDRDFWDMAVLQAAREARELWSHLWVANRTLFLWLWIWWKAGDLHISYVNKKQNSSPVAIPFPAGFTLLEIDDRDL